MSIILSLAVFSCTDDLLEKKPLNAITDADVWNDQTLIDHYLTGIYKTMSVLENETAFPLERPGIPYNYSFTILWKGPNWITEMSDECVINGWKEGSNYKYDGLRIGGGLLEWFEIGYYAIRAANEMIERLPLAPVSDAFRKEKIAEARYLRAYNYFSMVKRYGGVPIITRVQHKEDPDQLLFLPRDSEKAVYDFVISEMIDIYGELYTNANTGDWFMNNIKDLEISPALEWFKHCFAPQVVFINLVDQRYMKHTQPHKPGSTMLFNLVGVNDYHTPATGKTVVKLINSKGEVVTQQEKNINIHPLMKSTVPCMVELPKENGGYLLVAEFYPEGKKQPVVSRRYLKIGDSKNEKYDFYDMKP